MIVASIHVWLWGVLSIYSLQLLPEEFYFYTVFSISCEYRPLRNICGNSLVIG